MRVLMSVVVVCALMYGVQDVLAQVRCTMPNGVEITMQLSDCPSGAVSARTLDGAPVALNQAAPGPQAEKDAARPAAAKPAPAVASSADGSDGFLLLLLSWLITGLAAYGLYAWLRSSFGTSGAVRYCATCGHTGRGVTRTRGSLLIEIVLWLFFIVPGVIYSLWRHASRHKVCASCGAATLVPTSSPVARAALLREEGASSHAAAQRARVG